MTLASIVKMICVRVFIQLDHNSGVGSSKYMYLFPVCEIIYSVRIRRHDHDAAVFLSNHIVVTECSENTRVLLSLLHRDGNERILPLIQDDHVTLVDRSTVRQVHGKNWSTRTVSRTEFPTFFGSLRNAGCMFSLSQDSDGETTDPDLVSVRIRYHDPEVNGRSGDVLLEGKQCGLQFLLIR